MMSNDPQDATRAGDGAERAGSGRPSIRRDGASGPGIGAGGTGGGGEAVGTGSGGRARRWARLERAWWPVLIVTMVVFAAIPMVNLAWDMPTKDYGLWYQVGLAEWQGLDIYPRPETGRLFPFMYPPSAAAMLGMLSPMGPAGMLITLVAVNSASWIACILLSAWLAAGPGGRPHPLVVIVPTLSVIVLIHNIYLLGQPNLMLLALVLGAFACLRPGREVPAGALVATAAAIKAFPILVLGYLVYRRMWKATIATVAVLAAWLLIAPLPFRTPAQAVDDLSIWTRGMLFTYNTHGIAQRPLRSYSYKNQSIMAVMHRLLRDFPADGEDVLSGGSRLAPGAARPPKGLAPLDPSTDPLTILKPHPRARADAPSQPAPRWDEAIQGAESAFRTAWKVNVLSLDFRTVTMITLAVMLALSLFVLAMMPPQARRTRETDALEFALVTLLTVIFSPLSFNYAYVWTMYPTALALHRVLGDSSGPRRRRLEWAWLGAVLFIPALAIAMPKGAQAVGNLFVPALLLVLGLGWMLRSEGRRSPGEEASPVHVPHRLASDPLATALVAAHEHGAVAGQGPS
jgi:alpha-1,2-mannosyltransferase